MKNIAVVGCGLRIVAFARALRETYCKTHKIVALMDNDPGKMAGFAKRTELEEVPQYTDFDLMCAEVKPDLVIIGTIDTFHADYIVRALDKKIGVISEKPLCTTQEQCLAIREACRRNPEVFAVTSHNSRYRPVAQTLKKVLDSGVIGEIQSVEYRELLDRIHGKSYFRRWNSRRKYSNGLQLHKSSHHFDKLNFLLNSYAVEVSATGALVAYGASTKISVRTFLPMMKLFMTAMPTRLICVSGQMKSILKTIFQQASSLPTALLPRTPSVPTPTTREKSSIFRAQKAELKRGSFRTAPVPMICTI